jgi:hypothetical protein
LPLGGSDAAILLRDVMINAASIEQMKLLILLTAAGMRLPLLTAQQTPNVAGTWKFTVQLDGGGVGEPTFVFQQTGTRLSGTYSWRLGEHKVTGSLEGNRITFEFPFERDGVAAKAVYEGKVESATTLSGTVKFTAGGDEASGKWTARKTGAATNSKK